MRKTAGLLCLLLLSACTTSGPAPAPAPTGQYASLDCAALEAERVRLVTQLDQMPASDFAGIEKTRAEIDAVGAVQVEKGCAG